MIAHHPSAELFLAYANGSLDAVLTLAVEAHVDACPSCQDLTASTYALGGELLETLPPSQMDEHSLNTLLQRIDLPLGKKPSPVKKHIDPVLPPSLVNIPTRSRRWIAPGIWIRPLLNDKRSRTRAYLLGAGPNTVLPHHGHQGLELTQVLSGTLIDDGQPFQKGDFLQADGAHHHRPLVGADMTCVCLIASQGVPRGLVGLLLRALT